MTLNSFQPRIVVIGGGTGLSTMLRGLKNFTPNLTAIVTVTDDGGSSGTLRRELGVLPPGDIRNCLVALSGKENLMARLFQYRFPKVGSLSGHSFGNLFLTAMSALSGGFDEGISQAGEVLAIRGRVLPATLRSVNLQARLSTGRIVRGETRIGRSTDHIEELSIYPSPPPAAPRVLEAIRAADGIILGPGSLYTSVIANLLVEGIAGALTAARVPKIYVCNLMTQPGETSNFTFADHLQAIEQHAGKGVVTGVVVNDQLIPPAVRRRYAAEGSYPVRFDGASLRGIKVYRANLVSPLMHARHDPDKLARVIMKIMRPAVAGKLRRGKR